MSLKLLATFVSLLSVVNAALIPTSFILIGDSTTAVTSGWGPGFCGESQRSLASVLEPETPCFDDAKGGATTVSFLSDGSWDKAVAHIKQEVAKNRRTLVTIQFGHNDSHRSTKEVMHRDLTNMVQQIRDLKADPILVTSLVRRDFDANGKVVYDLEPWANVTTTVAKEQNTHYIDLHGASHEYCEAIGPAASHRLNPTSADTTHLNPHGMVVFGRMVADLIDKDYGLIGINLLPFVPNRELSYNISHGIPSY
ncbi:hypothetical protein VNI00_005234 [Paramarasmius palmivorus]|uniref:SGNH hydrolase-type esterase domain-containing protein n=1 Tax=Paramarasmius palmivorus TaxID=297713 RepID=A0AAW0DHE4_9AGAR